MNKTLSRVIYWAVVLVMPLFILLTAARVMVSTWYPRFEYAKPDFPPDPYGFTQAERLDYAVTSINFLHDPRPPEEAIVMLEALRLPGVDWPLFTAAELSHMVDVKRFTDRLWIAWGLTILVVVGGSIYLLARRDTRRLAYRAWRNGGVFTTGLLLLLAAFVLLSWRTFFITFHDIFFPPGTWTFDWTDSLIRTFPDRFWFDAGTMLSVGALVAGIVVALIGQLLLRRSRTQPAQTT
jgi:integral membrane protein (TIGR01906 family)